MPSPPKKKLSKAEIARRIDTTWRQVLEENGFVFDPAELKAMLKTVHISPHETLVRGLTMGAAIGLTSAGKEVGHLIKTEEQLTQVQQLMRKLGDQIPSMFRKAIKEVSRQLPRHGGPGRKPKLTAEEATLMCDAVSSLIRRKEKMKLKTALKLASEMSPKLLNGKTVSPRTIQVAWDNRDKYPPKKGDGTSR